MNTRTYARKLTKEELIKAGITLITEDGLVFKGETQVTPTVAIGQNYLVLSIYELDDEGNKIKIPARRHWNNSEKLYDSYVYKARTIGLHRAIWAWFNGEVPEGYVVDHINNKHENIEDYHLSNLQLLTPAENLAKERGTSNKQLPCKLNKPLSWYEDRLNKYLADYEDAKKNHDADRAHKLRTNIANLKAKIRYYVAHKEEAEKIKMEKVEEEAKKEAYHERAARLRELEEIVIAKRNEYLDYKYEFGPDHFVTLCYKKEWHDAVAERNHFLGISG